MTFLEDHFRCDSCTVEARYTDKCVSHYITTKSGKCVSHYTNINGGVHYTAPKCAACYTTSIDSYCHHTLVSLTSLSIINTP